MTEHGYCSECAILTVSQMSDAEAKTIAAGTPGSTLMQNAGLAVAHEITQRWIPQPLLVLCGPGNNGGDGFVVATALARFGWPIRVALVGERQGLRGDARIHANLWSGPIETVTPESVKGAAIVVDALFGAGLSRRLDPTLTDSLKAAFDRGAPVVAVDVPSGVLGDTGENLGASGATCTVTFARKKPGHVLLPGRDLCGEIVVADIGIPPGVLDMLPVRTWENHPDVWQADLPRPKPSGNKFSRGHALICGGYPMTGAARMAARAAARMGAGLTTIAVPEAAFGVYAAALTSIMVQPMANAQDLARLLSDKRFTALLVGPGAGVNDATRDAALAMLATSRPTLLDADALSVFSSRTDELARAIHGPCIITPHEGEFTRLFAIQGDKLTRARFAARALGAVVVLKGADTVVAAPDGRAVVNTNAPPSLATAGSGDVLGGFILGLLAQGIDAFQAAAAAVWMHGAAAADFGSGLLAEDLPDRLPSVLSRLDSRTR